MTKNYPNKKIFR